MRRVPALLSVAARPARPGRRRPCHRRPGHRPRRGRAPPGGRLAPDLPRRARSESQLNSYTGDGIALQTHPAGNDAQGAWAPTGERTAVMTLLLLGLERGVTRGTGRVRAALEVDAAGNAFAGSFTLEFVAAGGASRGEEEPLRVEGTRVRAEPPSAQQRRRPLPPPSGHDPERRRPPD